ncbi:RNA 2'-phosphotransferase [Niastella caeni]|uniref:Probable RNA 2'-phosphotransferase n=1 Tax=Niastella caeni TaxID=2569763 RepID=A0A4S8HPC0_9BACT|nr:RNA 2'-phosphotransferase [Niastella caeni]THU37105.1 RNA 2'-phosphotransferase [Niastella caeni]
MEKQLKHISKLLSLVLRHEPEHIGLMLDSEGWASVPELIEKVNQKGIHLDFATLQIIVDTNDKKRFAFDEDKTHIRANQGHSIDIELNLKSLTPPALLFHGTAVKNIAAIRESGLRKMKRHHVHLTALEETAIKVGQRHGKPVVLIIQALVMHEQNHAFYLSENGVWLADHVPPAFIIFKE